jgi:hypothetical protein
LGKGSLKPAPCFCLTVETAVGVAACFFEFKCAAAANQACNCKDQINCLPRSTTYGHLWGRQRPCHVTVASPSPLLSAPANTAPACCFILFFCVSLCILVLRTVIFVVVVLCYSNPIGFELVVGSGLLRCCACCCKGSSVAMYLTVVIFVTVELLLRRC